MYDSQYSILISIVHAAEYMDDKDTQVNFPTSLESSPSSHPLYEERSDLLYFLTESTLRTVSG